MQTGVVRTWLSQNLGIESREENVAISRASTRCGIHGSLFSNVLIMKKIFASMLLLATWLAFLIDINLLLHNHIHTQFLYCSVWERSYFPIVFNILLDRFCYGLRPLLHLNREQSIATVLYASTSKCLLDATVVYWWSYNVRLSHFWQGNKMLVLYFHANMHGTLYLCQSILLRLS